MKSGPVQSAVQKAIGDEEFRLFHNIDRIIFGHLVMTLKLTAKDAINFMAFWLWLEREIVEDLTLIKRLLKCRSQLVQNLADETLACIRCVESEVFPLPSLRDPKQLRLFVKKNITLKYLHENREQARKGISKMLNQVCYRAFDDILQGLVGGGGIEVYDAYSSSAAGNQQAAGTDFPAIPWQQQAAGSDFQVNTWQQQAAGSDFPVNPWPQQAVFPTNSGAVARPGVEWVPMRRTGPGAPVQNRSYSEDREMKSYFHQTMESLMSEELAGSHNMEARSIIITFSKGYPITEEEIRGFFSGTFGENMIESVYMPQVAEEEQVVNAVVVARSVWEANAAVGYGSTMYDINGKRCKVSKFAKTN